MLSRQATLALHEQRKVNGHFLVVSQLVSST